MNNKGLVEIPKLGAGTDYDQKITACMIPGDTIEEIENHLESLDFDVLKRLMLVYDCGVGDIQHHIARMKGIKCKTKKSKKESKNEESWGQYLARVRK